MKKRIICWGKDAEEKKVFFTFDLQTKENRVDGHIIPAEVLTQEFENLLANQWRNGGDAQFPEGAVAFSNGLTVTESIIPDGYTIDNPSLLKRSQTEWNFMVMSQKLADLYNQEVEDLKEKVDSLTTFEGSAWEALKGFWGKVNDQIREKNLLRDHGNSLRDQTNQLFEKMKDLRKKMDNEYRVISDENKAKLSGVLDELEQKIESGLSLQPIFNQLKKVQNDLKNSELTKSHRRKLWDRIDKAFKTVKSKRFGDNEPGKQDGKSRLQHRYDGLMDVIKRMDRSIQRDKNDLKFQNDRINTTSGQLEAEIRKAKLQMIEERISSKQEKLDDMRRTQVELEGRLAKEKEREAAKAAKKEKEAEIKKAKEEIEQKIAAEISDAQVDRKEEIDKLLTAANAINESRHKKKTKSKSEDDSDELGDQESPKEEKVVEGDQELTITEFVSDKLEDIVDTAKAVASIVGNKIEEVIEDLQGDNLSEEE